MTQTAMLAGDIQRINFSNLFVGSQKPATERNNLDSPALKTKAKKTSALLYWLKQSDVFAPVEFQTIPGGEIFQTDLLIVKFKLSDRYRDQFVLLRGLLEFSRPIKISVSSTTSDKSFQLHVTEDKAEIVASYLDTIQGLFKNELRFKKSLKAVLRFERAVKYEQDKIYEELRASMR